MPTSAEAAPPFPLSDPDNLDVVAELTDGGVDMLVVTIGPLDESDETCRRLREKLSSYLYAAVHPNFPNVYPEARNGRVRIFLSDAHAISDRAAQVVQEVSREALARGVELRLGGWLPNTSLERTRDR
jgi:hypothetical protein